MMLFAKISIDRNGQWLYDYHIKQRDENQVEDKRI